MSTADTIHAVAHAKVNVHLGVGPLRADGFHELATVFQSLDLHDTLHFTKVAPDHGLVRALHCAHPDVPEDQRNLAWQAAAMMLADADYGVEISIDKGIPTAGGMAGGSADAAATLVALNAWREQPYEQAQLLDMAAQLGSDVPFTLLGHTQLAHGRGEQLTQVISRGTYHWVLAFANEGLSTPAVFQHLDQMQRTPQLDTQPVLEALASGDSARLAQVLHNDLQPAAFSLRPELRKTWHMGMAAGALAGIVSGSGPTMAFLCSDAASAESVAEELGLYGKVAVAQGPAPGAHCISKQETQ